MTHTPPSLRALALLGAALALACGGDDPLAGYDLVPFVGAAMAPDVTTHRLCLESADPEAAPDKVFIHCELEGATFAPADLPPKDELVVVAYNFERGYHLDEQIALLGAGTDVPRPDILLASELDRGCARTGSRNVPREVAEALGMDYVFAVEFVELPGEAGPGRCEHGNALFSRYPMFNVRAVRHATNLSWYVPPEERPTGGEPRLGGRVAVLADVLVGDRLLHAFALHFESNSATIQIAQAEEMAAMGLDLPSTVVQGGDTNAPLYLADLTRGTRNDDTTQAYLSRGYEDAHAELPVAERPTRGGLVLDLIFALSERGGLFHDSAVCDEAVCGGLSDHLPVYTTARLP